MLTRMEITDTNDLVNSLFEPCAHFTAAGDGAPVCERCGWLEAEHLSLIHI